MKPKVKKAILYSTLTILLFSFNTACKKKELPKEVNRQILQESLKLGTQFMLSNQRDDGSFNYQYDWHTKKFSQGNSQVRQAGAQWGLALVYNNQPSDRVQAALEESIRYFIAHSRLDKKGGRYVIYPETYTGSLGTVALCALTLVDYLRTMKDKLGKAPYNEYALYLDEYIKFLLNALNKDMLWYSQYDYNTGKAYGPGSPYFDGEALLALVKAAKYMDRKDLVPVISKAVKAGIKKNIDDALKKDKDSDTTKGYYQWSSMAMFELATSGWKDTQQYGKRVIDLANWMIDVHRTLRRTRNTGYAYEGIIHAYQLAKENRDTFHVNKFSRVIQTGLSKLTSWQVGGPMPNKHIRKRDQDDKLAVGGIQNHRKEPFLRIDVTQHQMHAVILALRYVYVNDGRTRL